MSPADGCMKPARQDRSVVFPQPEAPSATTKSPGSRPRLTFERASVVRPEVPAYFTLTLRISSLLKEGCRRTNSPEEYRERRDGASETRLVPPPARSEHAS